MANQPNQVGGPIHHSILDSIITGIFGAPTDQMTQAEGAKVERERAGKRQDAYSMAESVRKNPGAEFMAGPQLGGGSTDILNMLGSIVKLFGG